MHKRSVLITHEAWTRVRASNWNFECFGVGKKIGELGEKPLESRTIEPTKNSTHLWRQEAGALSSELFLLLSDIQQTHDS